MDDRDQMDRDRRPPWIPWAFTSVALVLVAFAAFTMGQHQAVAAAGEPVRRVYWGFFPDWIFFWVIFWVFIGGFRRMWWYGCGYPHYRPWRHRRYSHPYDDEREFEEWHRREHDRMEGSRSRGSSSPPGSDRGPIT